MDLRILVAGPNAQATILDLDRAAFGSDAWTAQEISQVLRPKSRAAVIAWVDGTPVGYMIYELQRSRVKLIMVAVHPAWQRGGVGRALLAKAVAKCDTAKTRTHVEARVRDRNLDAQLFFKACGWKCVDLIRDAYQWDEGERDHNDKKILTTEDALVFQFTAKEAVPCNTALS